MRAEIQKKLETLPDSPGVYLMRGPPGTDDGGGTAGEVFYIGKAKSLRDRLRSYFSGSDTRAFVALLDELLADIEVVLTDTEKEALILENDLIKQHQPRFNIKLTDDKRFLCLRLSTTHAYPRLEVVRRFGKDRARYFGPYHSATAIRESLRLINRHFQLRTCSDTVLKTRTRPCLQYQIKRCPAPCVYEMKQTYRENVDSVVAFLEGRTDELVASLDGRMRRHAAALEFEAAAALRDQIRAVDRSMERQRIVTRDFANRDVVGFYREGPAVELHVMRTRAGRLIDARRYSLEDSDLPTRDLLADFTARYYAAPAQPGASNELPDEILLPPEMDWATALGQLLTERRGRTVRALVPQRGDKKRLVNLANRNARQAFLDKQREAGAARTAVDRLKRALHLRRLPERIECFDVSHLGGENIVASAVRFEQGVPVKELYRTYKVRSTDGQDDFQSMYEVLGRRARRGLEEGDLPDLIVIDGGKGQLAAARAAFDDHGIDHIDLVALAKGRRESEGGDDADRSPERVFVFGHKNAIVLRQNSAELFLLTRARDEAHRFAVRFQRKLRRKAATRSELDGIPGVGPKRRKALLESFGSVARIRRAPEDALAQVVGPATARRVREHFGGST